jgi:glutathione S-transferase
MITISAFDWVPEMAKGHVRDLRVRWALEEAGLPYRTKLINHQEKLSEGYREWQPFCQVPAYDDGEVRMFESGAIVLHIGEKSEALLPKDPAARARAMTWVMAALNSLDPFILWQMMTSVFNADKAWAKEAQPDAESYVKKRLASLAQHLAGRDYLEGRFTVGDLMMACTLRELDHTDFVTGDPVLGPYLKRCEARPAFQRALAAQLADFTGQPQAA